MGIGLWIKAWELGITSEEGLETFSSALSAVGIAYLFKTNKEIKTRMVFGHWKMKQRSMVLWSLRERTQIRGALWHSELTALRQFPDGSAGRGSTPEFSCLSELRSRSQYLGRPRFLGFMKQSTREEETTEKKRCAVVGLPWVVFLKARMQRPGVTQSFGCSPHNWSCLSSRASAAPACGHRNKASKEAFEESD